MTQYQIEQTEQAYSMDNYECVICGSRLIQRGHVIAQRKWALKRYGKNVLDHCSNIFATCDKQNATVQIDRNSEQEIKEPAERIQRCIDDPSICYEERQELLHSILDNIEEVC